MKTYLPAFLFFALILQGCDKVKFPLEDTAGVGTSFSGDTLYSDSTYTQQRLLIEEFTGHRCSWCPAGAEKLKDLDQKFPGGLVLVGIHGSNYAIPNVKEGYPADYRTDAGNYIIDYRGVLDFPSAMFNREGTGSQLRGFWDQTVHDFMGSDERENPKIQLILRNIRNNPDDKNNLQVTAIANEELTGAYDLVVYLTEDGIVSPQLDARLEIQGLDPNVYEYTHNHVLRTSVGPAPGNVFIEDGLASGERFAVSYDVLAKDRQTEWVTENLTFVAFVIERSSGLVVQAETVPFTKN
ncbi:Omp28-related outer membrane protein [bacterium SCSIO 12741]|nr:Omp28-related outer membrane protein [bacterium SCSIO 12741]